MPPLTGSKPASDARVIAPPGRRLCEVTENLETGGYRVFSALDESGPEPRAGQFYMLAAADGWGQRTGRPYLPRAFSVAEATRATAVCVSTSWSRPSARVPSGWRGFVPARGSG